jgi:outer membrane protein assembly factor BamB
VTASNGTIYALQQSNHAVLWSHSFTSSAWSGLTYDAGQVFTVDQSGTMTAFNALTGAVSWSISLPGQYMFSSPPTAYNGVVYVGGAGSGGTVYAVSESTGTLLWTQSVENGDDSSPAVDGNGVYVTYACGQDYDFSPLSGALLWHHTSGCEGGGGNTPVLANETIFGRDSSDGDLILSATTGAQISTFSSATAPAVGGGSAYALAGGSLTAVASSGQGSILWTYSGINGDGTLTTAPLLAGGLLIEGSTTGELYALDPSDGDIDWSDSVGSSIASGGSPTTGLGAGENTIVVPAGSTLAAYTGANVGTGTPTNTLAPSVSGTPEAGQAVGADVGLWTALPGSYTYQWYLCNGSGGGCQEINGATNEAYVPPTVDIGDTLEVAVTATNGSGTASAVTSAASASIVPAPPAVVASPSISGTAAVGDELAASPGTWTNNPTSYQYQWLACTTSTNCTQISGATQSSFAVTSAQAGFTLEVLVVASNGTGPSGAATSAATVVVPVPAVATSLTLTSSANPATVGTSVVFTATLSRVIDGGSISFDVNGQPIQGCDWLALNSSDIGATCTVSSIGDGTWTVTAQYSGDALFLASSASLTEVVKASTSVTGTGSGSTSGSTNKTPAPPSVSVGTGEAKNKPNFRLTLTAVRTDATPYRYWFALKGVRCLNRAAVVVVTIRGRHVDDRCGAQIELASKSLAVHHYYAVTLQAVRYGATRSDVVRGHAYHVRLYMPGSEAQWTPITGVTLPMIGHSARLVF